MSEPIQVPMPGAALPILMKQGGKKQYTLSELRVLIDPVYRVYNEQIRRCISGLTAYAAQCAAAHREEQIPKLREHIVMMGGFWSTEEDTSIDPYEISERNYVSAPFENVDFRRNGMSFFPMRHTGVIQPYTPHHLPG